MAWRERDFVGYGGKPPVVEWPDGKRVAVSICMNYEEGAEQSIAFGDPAEEILGEWGGYLFPPGVRNVTNESFVEYGSRSGVWRLLDVLDRHGVKATFFACAIAFERNPVVARAVTERGHEVCSHGYRWESVDHMTREEERERILAAIRSFESTAGVRPCGWYGRNGLGPNSRDLLVELGFLYDSNEYNDDLPYFVETGGGRHLIVPYTGDVNDVHFWIAPGFVTADHFATYLRDTLDCLLAEGRTAPKMMSVGLHMRIAGRPGRAVGLERFLEYARSKPEVWFARRDEIARWWIEHAP